jgi:hypothetical protein
MVEKVDSGFDPNGKIQIGGHLMIDLYHHGSSVCAAKARLALGEKGLGWEGHYLDITREISSRQSI